MKKNVKITKRVDNIEAFVNSETGETFLLENPNSTVTIAEDSDYVVHKSKNFVVIESNALEYVISKTSNTDYKKFTRMANWLKGDFNIVFNNNIPHTLETLSKALDLSKDETTKTINRLIDVGLAAYTVCNPSGFGKQKLYMLNPTVVRKRSRIHKEIYSFFPNLLNINK